MADTIMVVDDEADIRDLAEMILRDAGFNVAAASSGEQALQMIGSVMPDLVLLDVVMLGGGGLETCKMIKSQPVTRHIPVVMFTALGRDVDKKMTADVGADGHFTKPFSQEDLLGEVRRRLEASRPRKFSRQLGVERDILKGRKILFEFDPSVPYQRAVRDFIMESASNGETTIVLTQSGSRLSQALQGDSAVKLIEMSPNVMLSSIVERHPNVPLSITYDSLTDLALSTDFQAAYGLARNALRILDSPRVTSLFLLNTSAHEQREVSVFRGLFSSHVVYGREGVSSVKIS
ncbi:response regulator [Candidatus Bathyarchaeota archaeon]|nr:response regulator [Candidatus Bathyarchaeota archaeon]